MVTDGIVTEKITHHSSQHTYDCDVQIVGAAPEYCGNADGVIVVD